MPWNPLKNGMRAYRLDDFKSLDELRSHEEEMPKARREINLCS
jgi:hypothetical protein